MAPISSPSDLVSTADTDYETPRTGRWDTAEVSIGYFLECLRVVYMSSSRLKVWPEKLVIIIHIIF